MYQYNSLIELELGNVISNGIVIVRILHFHILYFLQFGFQRGLLRPWSINSLSFQSWCERSTGADKGKETEDTEVC